MKTKSTLDFARGKQAGFNLIELLVVIAIIAILSTIALAALNSARNKAADAAVKAGLANAMSQANIYYQTNMSFTGACADATIVGIFAKIKTSTKDTTASIQCDVNATAGSDGQLIAMSAVLRGEDTAWCVDGNTFRGYGTATTNAKTGVCAPKT